MKAMRRMISFVLALLLLVPAYAVISAGTDNSYGHPHAEVLSRLRAVGAKVLRTDESGTIRLYSDGENVTMNN